MDREEASTGRVAKGCGVHHLAVGGFPFRTILEIHFTGASRSVFAAPARWISSRGIFVTPSSSRAMCALTRPGFSSHDDHAFSPSQR